VVASATSTTGSTDTGGSTGSLSANAGSLLLSQAGEHGRPTSDINTKANPLVEDEHGATVGAAPSQLAASFSQLAGAILQGGPTSSAGLSFAQLVQSMAAFGAEHNVISSLSQSDRGEVTNPIAVL